MTTKAALTQVLTEKKALVDGIASEFKVDEKNRFDISTKQFKDYRDAVAEVKELKGLLDDMDTVANVDKYLNEPETVPEAARDVAGPEFKSLGDMFINSSEYKQFASSGVEYQGNRMRAEMEGKSVYNLAAGTHTIPALGATESLGIAEAARRKWHVRDLFPKSSTKAAVLYGVRETGFTNNAAILKQRSADGTAWNDGAPESKPELTPVMYPVAEIARPLGSAEGRLLAAGADPRIKQRLKDETEAALERGVYGSPFIIVDCEAFWGADRLDQVERWLQGGW
jgi:hypothetical protein